MFDSEAAKAAGWRLCGFRVEGVPARRLRYGLLVLLCAWLLSGCGPASSATPAPPAPPASGPTPTPLSLKKDDLEREFNALPPGDASEGKTKFVTAGCAACHALEADRRVVGPSMAGIGTRAATTEPDLSAELYLYKSITRPDGFVVAGFTPGLMPKTFVETLSPQTLADLIAYLLTLE